MPLPTTRIEIADLIEHEFDGSPKSGGDLVTAARSAGGRQRVIDALEGLPGDQFVGLNELWKHLPDLQVEP